MFSDAIIDLIESGAVTGQRKSLDRGKVAASFCMGTQRLYDYIHNNPVFAFHPTEYINDPFVISRRHKMVAINVALEVDLTGQVCADSLGNRFYSGIGGQVDFNRGAARSRGRPGRHRPALDRPARRHLADRFPLEPGAGVVTTRGDVHYVVTEYGVAYLHGKSVQERAIALISIAHPELPRATAPRGDRGQVRAARNARRRGQASASARPSRRPACSWPTARRSISGTCIPPTCRG